MLFTFLISRLLMDCCQFAKLALRSRAQLAAENLFLRKQLALYQERKAKRRPTSVALRWTMVVLGRFFVRAPMANVFCERLIGTIRRECLDWVIPFGESHLRQILRKWVTHYNRGRPHSSLGPGIPEALQVKASVRVHRHELPYGYRVVSKPILGSLRHEYRLEKEVA